MPNLKHPPLTLDQERYIRQNAETLSPTEITENLSVNYQRVLAYMRNNNIPRLRRARHSVRYKPPESTNGIFNVGNHHTTWLI